MARHATAKRVKPKKRRAAPRQTARAQFPAQAPSWLRSLLQVHPVVSAATVTVIVVAIGLSVNWAYQVLRKPSELFFPVSGSLHKTPSETWASYAPLFKQSATAVMTPTLLAALAQIEASGNPVARTYWRVDWTATPLDIYRPASSAVGMYQITDGTYTEASRYCVRNHHAVERTAKLEPGTCGLAAPYLRTIPAHAVEMTSGYLDRQVAGVLARQHIKRATLAQKQRLATTIHLCGAGRAASFARRGFRFSAGERCGAHNAKLYVERVAAMQAVFAKLSSRQME